MKKKPDVDLFTGDSDSHNNACLNYQPGTALAYAEGYRLAADILTAHIENTSRDQDTLVYPVLFLYRHHLELAMKYLIRLCRQLVAEPEQYGTDGHDLNRLWEQARKIVRDADETFPAKNFSLTGALVKQFVRADSRSTAFRYDLTRENGPSLPEITHINLRRFREKFSEAAGELDRTILHAEYLCSLGQDMLPGAAP
ncbi:hypothetical protein PMPD1_4357 (plasmid) [Paramixta manurensis]|uniref:HEPN domain-containing protein n=1 Tax=Paramixta manurensis TaxID=2740817 RepID=A0A6M8UEG4_9GAMM|nr:hypothetical protein PMPD1_4357 [Erwiniaceae bacterium PD-1]